MWAAPAFGQVLIVFDNNVPGVVRAPVYGPEPSDPTVRKTGNTPAGIPAGTQSYDGTALQGTNYTAQVFGGSGGTPEDLLFAMTPATTFYSEAAQAGFIVPVNLVLPLPAGYSVTLQMRVWDNRAGAVTSWSQVLANPTVLRGVSPVYDTVVPPPATPPPSSPMAGLRSFNLFVLDGPPVISDIPGQDLEANTSTGPISFLVGDAETPAGSLNLFAHSSNTNLVPPANIVFGGGGSNRTITVTPAADQAGESLITVTVSDGTNAASDDFGLKVMPVPSVADSVDIPHWVWVSGGSASWRGQRQVTHDGEDAAESGLIGHSQSSWVATTVMGTGMLSFHRKVSSETNRDTLVFFLDDSAESGGGLSGEIDWRPEAFEIPPGTHRLKWEYSKNGSNTAGLDRGWLDQVQFTGSPVQPPLDITVPIQASLAFGVSGSGMGPKAFQWWKNSRALPGATRALLVLSNLTVADGGEYTVLISEGDETTRSAPIRLILEVANSPPGADFFTNANRLWDLSGVIRGVNTNATREPFEPWHAAMPGYHSVWYAWTAPTNGIATFHTRGSTFDTLLAIYSGTGLSNLTCVASDDDRGGFRTSEAQVNVRMGTDYLIAVDGFDHKTGSYALSWQIEQTSDVLPVILSSPAHQTIEPGGPATFAVLADSPTNVTYQWLFNGRPISGGTSATLMVTNAQFSDLGSYLVRIRNQYGRLVESSPVLLTFGSCPRLRLDDRVTTHLEEACSSPTSWQSRMLGSLPPPGTNPPSGGFGIYVRLEAEQTNSVHQAVPSDEYTGTTGVCDHVPVQPQSLFVMPVSNGVIHCEALVTNTTPESPVGTSLVVYYKGTTNVVCELPESEMWTNPIARSASWSGPARLRFWAAAGGVYCLEVSPRKICTSSAKVSLIYRPIWRDTKWLELSVTSSPPRVVITSIAHWPFDLQASSDLSNTSSWSRVFPHRPEGPCHVFRFFQDVTNNTARFYRAVFTNDTVRFPPAQCFEPSPGR
jgi:hypothetical protein